MERKMTCVIVEDDRVSREVLEDLADRTGLVEVLHSFDDPVKAVNWLSGKSIDLLLLDMEMPNLSGLQLLASLPKIPQVIIISGKEQYAIDAIDYNICAYLLKPVDDFSKFLKAILKAKERIAAATPQGTDVQESIYVKIDSLFEQVSFASILWAEAFGDYVKIVVDKKVITAYTTMKQVEEKLPANLFVRVHRSYIVNLAKVSNIGPTNLQVANKIIPISGSYRENLMAKIKTL